VFVFVHLEAGELALTHEPVQGGRGIRAGEHVLACGDDGDDGDDDTGDDDTDGDDDDDDDDDDDEYVPMKRAHCTSCH
jgi:hypothetical protein